MLSRKAVKPLVLLGEEVLPDGSRLTLHQRDADFMILLDKQPLMTSRVRGSEEDLATLGCVEARKRPSATVLVGGLGMGFTLRAALDVLPAGATVVVAELSKSVVEWNRGPLGPLAGNPMDDPRVRIELGDVATIIKKGKGRFDAMLLDVDNGPDALTQVSNAGLYGHAGLLSANAALKVGGTYALWSAGPSQSFERSLERAGFRPKTHPCRARAGVGTKKHVVFIGQK